VSWDALAHASWRGKCWNGRPATTVDERGAAFSGIDRTGPIVGRGVLLDLARTAGVDRLEGGTPIGPDELDAAVEAAGVEIAAGDILLLRTGHVTVLPDKVAYLMTTPGPSVDAVPWFRHHDVAAAATDSLAFEVYPNGDEVVGMPVHALNLVMVGLTQGQNFWLEDLAASCAADGRYTFLLSATPIPFANALGGPVAPVAIK
jgi:kynurenine formamidase